MEFNSKKGKSNCQSLFLCAVQTTLVTAYA